MSKGQHAGHFAYQGLGLEIFSEHSLEKIHLATLSVLERTGVWIESNNALNIFKKCGAVVNEDEKNVKIPAYIVEEAIRSAPPQVFLAGRSPEYDVMLESDRVHWVPFGTGVKVWDLYTGAYRDPVIEDFENISKLCDACENYDFLIPTVMPVDVDQDLMTLYLFQSHFSNSSKPWLAYGEDDILTPACMEMAAAIVGGMQELKERPIIFGGGCPQSPLTFSENFCKRLIRYAEARMPFCPISMAMAGGSAPVTLAGTLVTHNAEILASITLSQMVRPGTPIMYGSSTCGLDMRKGLASVGTPELALINAAVARLARYYSIPSLVAGG